jgi:hypothetical protein
MVRFAGAEPVVLPGSVGCDSILAFAHLALCACAILRREAADMIRVGAGVIRVGCFIGRDVPEPFSDSTSAIA